VKTKNDMTKILFISPQPFFEWRGSPIRVGFNVQALAELGYQVDLLTLPIGEERIIPGVAVFRVPNIFGIKKISIGPSLLKVLFDVLLLFRGLRLVTKNRYDIIHGVEDAGIIAVLLGKLAKSRVIFEKHSDPYSYKAGVLKNLVLGLYAKVEQLTAEFSDAVIGTGPGLVSQVRKMGADVSAFHIFDIPSSLVEPSETAAAKISSQLKSSDDEVLITFVGSFAVYQGIGLMFSAIPEVVNVHPNARFVIIGGSEEEIKLKKKTLAVQNIAQAVTFLGKVHPDELPNYLAASDILLVPRQTGVNTPLKILDYLKVGRAIVATDVPANTLILDNRTAILVGSGPSAFASGICRLIDDPVLRESLGRNGKKRYQEKYNFNLFKCRLSDCYRHVLK
jgi:glycosyltransferase involved in cell wall biosynthesis